MVQGLFWIVGTYMLGAAAVHAAHRRFVQRSESGDRHYILYSFNDERHIEWAVRSLSLFYWLQGRSVTITVIDEGSTDHTLAIVHSLSRQLGLDLCYVPTTEDHDVTLSSDPSQNSDIIHIRLRHPEDLRKLPLQYN